jgi:yecA family protein
LSAGATSPDLDELEALLHFTARAAIDGMPDGAFLRSFAENAAAIAPEMFGPIDDPAARRAAIMQFGRMFWSAMPKPHQGWRVVAVPKPERNASCPCGSGRKYKQCCQRFESAENIASELNMVGFVLDLWPDARLHEIPIRRLDPEALADTAEQWLKKGETARGIRLLEPLFDDLAHLDDRHISCFDGLCDLYLDAGMEAERGAFVARIAEHRDRYLASAALQRATVLASDHGDFEMAWEQFERALRLTPDEPSLAHLEVLVLQSEGRRDEAMARAKVWAARLRRLGVPEYADLIGFLEQMAENPDRAMLGLAERSRPDAPAWSELLDSAPAVESLYAIERTPMPDGQDGPGRVACWMQPSPVLARVEREWHDRFAVRKPDLTSLYGDAGSVCEQFGAVVEFMRSRPRAWQSFEILDDLALIARDWFDEDERVAETAVLLRLTERATQLLRLCLGGSGEATSVIEWAVMKNRPPLRLVAQRIDALLERFADDDSEKEIAELEAWMLEINPQDNHGYRNLVMQDHLRAGEVQRAIALAERYSDDVGDMNFDYALALFQAGRPEEAARAWARGATSTPAIAATLLARNPKPPRFDGDGAASSTFEALGGPENAWRYRTMMFEIWEASGALAWAKTLPRVSVPKAGRQALRKPQKQGRAQPGDEAVPNLSGPAGESELLRQLAADDFPIAPLHGMLTAIALSPDLMKPSQWLSDALALRTGASNDGIDGLNASLRRVMGLYNCLTTALHLKRGEGYAPSVELPTVDQAQAIEWARGFMRIVEQGRAAWRNKASTAESKAALTAIERTAAGMIADDRLQQESVTLKVALYITQEPTWRDVLAAATRALASI